MSNLSLLGTKYLHGLVYFVADAPTAENLSPNVPLVGTESYKRLLSWMGEMNIDITRVRLYNQCDGPFSTPLSQMTLNKAIELQQIKVIALGQKAAAYLGKAGINEFFILPHPSKKNRLLNDQKYIDLKLANCKQYIYEGVLGGLEKCKEGIEEDLSTEQELPSHDGSSQLE